jgi:MoxR-like ATPase
VNRATPKTQSALLEAMEEQTVSVGKTTYKLEQPFFVLATQNPLEMEGTYPLPEAQLDRFFMKLKVEYPNSGSMTPSLNRTTRVEEPHVTRVLDGPQILDMRKTVRSVPIARPIQDYAVRIMLATHANTKHSNPLATKYARCGASSSGGHRLWWLAEKFALCSTIAYMFRATTFGRSHTAPCVIGCY